MTYQDAMKATTRNLNIRGTVTLADTTVLTLTNAHIMSYSINEGGSFIPLGTAASTSYILELANSSGEWFKGGSIIGVKVLQGAAVHIEIGAYPGVMPLQVGGTNLILDSEQTIEISTIETAETVVYPYDGAVTLKPSTTYTLSFDSAATAYVSSLEVFFIKQTGTGAHFSRTFNPHPTPQHYTDTFTTANDVDGTFQVRLDNNGSTEAGQTAYLWLNKIKLELGNIATGWSPAPEDVEAAYLYSDAGLWYVNKSSGREGGRFVLSGNDSLMTAYETKFADTLEYTGSTDLQDVFDHILTKGVTITGTLACNAAAIVAVKPDWGENCTIRSALSYAAMAGGCFVRVSRAGALELVTLNNTAAAKAISTAGYIELDNQNTYFAFNRVKVLPRGAKAETVYTEGVVNGGLPEASNNTIVITDNPIFALSAANPQTMTNALATALTGYELELMTFRWRGDPTFVIGDNVALTDRRAEVTTTQIIQQQMRYELGLTSDITCQLNLETMLPSAISPNGTISPIAFGLGSLDPSILIAKSITADEIAAHTITAGEIAALTITAAEIAAQTVTAAKMATGTITAESGIIADLAVTSAKIATAGISFAKIKDLVTGVGIFSTGAGDELYINRLYVVAANIANLTVGELVFKDAQGDLYRLGVDGNGDVETTLVEVLYQNISDTALLSISEYVVYKGANAPASPFVGKIWIDTDTDITSRCTAINPDVWEPVKASELHTSYISAVATGLEILSTGKIDIKSGGDLNVLSGGNLNIKSGADIEIESGGDINIAAGGHLNLTASSGIYIGTTPMQVGGTNLLPNSGFEQGWVGWVGLNDSSTLNEGSAWSAHDGKNLCVIGAAGDFGGVYYPIAGLIVGQQYTLSGDFIVTGGTGWGFYMAIADYQDISLAGNVWKRYAITFIATATTSNIIIVSANTDAKATFIDNIKLELGNIATDWSPAPSDPATGVKTSHITIETDSIDIASGGSLNVIAPTTLAITSGATNATAIAVRNDTNYFLSAGHLTQASAPFSVSKSGLIKADAGTIGGFTISGGQLYDTATSGDKLGLFPADAQIRLNDQLVLGIASGHSIIQHQGAVDTFLVVDAGARALSLQSGLQVLTPNLYVYDYCSALSFTDRTPSYDGDALTDLSIVKSKGDKIDHTSLPKVARKKIKRTEHIDGKVVEVEEDGRDLGMMISILTKAVQQLTTIVTDQQKQIDKLGAKK